MQGPWTHYPKYSDKNHAIYPKYSGTILETFQTYIIIGALNTTEFQHEEICTAKTRHGENHENRFKKSAG